jgi:hypothetical protein
MLVFFVFPKRYTLKKLLTVWLCYYYISMSAEERMAASEKGMGYENGLGSMSAEERMAAGQKGYENGLGRTAARKKRSSNDKIGNAWEKKYAELKRCVEMPEKGTPLHT